MSSHETNDQWHERQARNVETFFTAQRDAYAGMKKRDVLDVLREASDPKKFGEWASLCADAVVEIQCLRFGIELLRNERDEARREICRDESYNHKSGVTPCEVAEDRGWDCFNGGSDATA
jgi:hypothetical protein